VLRIDAAPGAVLLSCTIKVLCCNSIKRQLYRHDCQPPQRIAVQVHCLSPLIYLYPVELSEAWWNSMTWSVLLELYFKTL